MFVITASRKRTMAEMNTNKEPDVIVISDDDEEMPIVNEVINPESLKKDGNTEFAKKNWSGALKKYSQAILLLQDAAACTDHAAYYGNRAATYIMLGMYKNALEDCAAAVTLDPSYIKGYTRMLKCKICLGDISGAKAILQQNVDKCSADPGFLAEAKNIEAISKYYDDGQRAMTKGEYRTVVFCMGQVLAIAPSIPICKLLKAECCAYLGRYQEAQEIANSVLLFDKQNADAIFVRGICLYYEDNIELAVTHFQRALKYAPDHPRVMKIYRVAKALKQKKEEGNVAFKAGNLQDAFSLYSDALTIDPVNTSNSKKLYFNRATVLAKLNRLQEAISDCNEALKLDPKYIKALLRRAKCHTDLEAYEEAVKDYELVVQMEGTREHRKMLSEAKIELKKSLRKDYYKILGVSKTASTDDIKKAYRKRALVHHPDRHSNASEEERLSQEKQFKEVGEAYGILSDPKKRSRYDSGQDLEDSDMGSNDCPAYYTFADQGGFPFNFAFQFG